MYVQMCVFIRNNSVQINLDCVILLWATLARTLVNLLTFACADSLNQASAPCCIKKKKHKKLLPKITLDCEARCDFMPPLTVNIFRLKVGFLQFCLLSFGHIYPFLAIFNHFLPTAHFTVEWSGLGFATASGFWAWVWFSFFLGLAWFGGTWNSRRHLLISHTCDFRDNLSSFLCIQYCFSLSAAKDGKKWGGVGCLIWW